ncbi:hypothetical protein ACTXNC_13325 [Psychrobacter celer]|uniref:hypothetical protein n=1 Tax=Psychrobacter celer TaxID=306572 RepID=UPI003FD2B4AA
MFYILEEIFEHIMMFLNIPNRPFFTALVKQRQPAPMGLPPSRQAIRHQIQKL